MVIWEGDIKFMMVIVIVVVKVMVIKGDNDDDCSDVTEERVRLATCFSPPTLSPYPSPCPSLPLSPPSIPLFPPQAHPPPPFKHSKVKEQLHCILMMMAMIVIEWFFSCWLASLLK